MRLRNGKTVFFHSFEVELDGFMDELRDSRTTLSDRHASRKIGNVCSEARWALLDYNEKLHGYLTDAALHAIVSTMPPSTRNAAPVVADACGEQT